MACWLAVVGLMALAWVAWLLGAPMLFSVLVGQTACAMSAVAAVVQIRCYSARVCRLIRVTAGIERPGASIEPFRHR